MTATSAQLDEAKEIADIAARRFPEALRLIGGPHVSVDPSAFLKETQFQVACLGEGVETLIDLILAFLAQGIQGVEHVSGIAWKNPLGVIMRNSSREFLFPLDDYPFASDSLDLFLADINDVEKNGRDLVYILAGAGCPYRCIFCAQHSIHQGRIRERSAESIFAEMKSLFGKGFRKFAMVQETFLRDPERLARFCSLIEDSGLPMEWTIEARADQLDLEKLDRMKKAGLRFVQLGVESGDPELLIALKKNVHLRQVVDVRDWCEELRIDTAFYMLVGLPGQSWQSILRSAIFLRDHLPFNRITMHISTAVAIPYPGTQIFKEKSVRLVDLSPRSLSWPGRNCEIIVDEEGVLTGRNFTETDVMISSEIMEAYTFLDDFGHFLLQANYNPEFAEEERLRARDFAYRLLYMIARRTLRDLILRAQTNLTPEKYRQAHAEILARDEMGEGQLKDVTPSTELWPEILFQFLASVTFQNGFHTMKILSIPRRVEWIKLCAVIWRECDHAFSKIRFEADEVKEGERLNDLLENIPAATIDDLIPDRPLELMGLAFDLSVEKSLLTVRKMPQSSQAVF